MSAPGAVTASTATGRAGGFTPKGADVVDHTKEVAVPEPRDDLATRVANDPDGFRQSVVEWLARSPVAEEVAASRDEFMRRADYFRSRQPSVMRELLRAARLTEWEMARRWPAQQGKERTDDRPLLTTGLEADARAWTKVYAVGRVDREVLLSLTEPSDLTQSAIIKRAAVVDIAAQPVASLTDDGLFDVIYADPPWSYSNSPYRGDPGNHYPTMPLADICALAVPAADDCVLYLWATAPLLVEALQVVEAWGFTYKTCAVWDKEKVGVGYWFRGQHELLLVGVKGRVSPPEQRLRVPSVYREARTAHSRKPDHVRTLIASWFPDARRLEMFARRPAPGWVVYGNQVDSSLEHLPAERWDPDDPAVTGQHSLLGDEGVA